MGLGQGQPILKQPLNVEPDRLTHRLLRLFSCLARSHTPRQVGGVRGVATVGNGLLVTKGSVGLPPSHTTQHRIQGIWGGGVCAVCGGATPPQVPRRQPPRDDIAEPMLHRQGTRNHALNDFETALTIAYAITLNLHRVASRPGYPMTEKLLSLLTSRRRE